MQGYLFLISVNSSSMLYLFFIGNLAFLLGFTPPGTKKIPDTNNLYMDKTEISNISWREYLYWVKNNEDEKTYRDCLPDPQIWNVVYEGDISKPGEFDHHPVVGISYEQALAYCKWRSMVVTQISPKKVVYSLPALKDYQKAQNVKKRLPLCSNVQEMTATEGVAMANDQSCTNTVTYTKSSTNLGFRCIARIAE